MFEKLLKYYKKCQSVKQSLEIEIGHNKYAGWCISIYHNDSRTEVVNTESENLDIASANAFLQLENWARDLEDLEDIVYNL